MTIACSTFTWDDLPIASALHELGQAGFEYAELGAFEGWGHANASDALADASLLTARISQAAWRQRVKITAANAGFGAGLDLDDELRRAAALMDVLRDIGVRHVTVQPGGTSPAAVCDRLAALLERARARSLALSVETHIHSATETVEGALECVEAVPGLTLTLDPSHYLIQGLSIDALRPLLPHVAHVHLRDAAPGVENIQVPWGDGRLDLVRLVELLRGSGYDGAYGVEIIRTDKWGIAAAEAPAEARKLGDAARRILEQA